MVFASLLVMKRLYILFTKKKKTEALSLSRRYFPFLNKIQKTEKFSLFRREARCPFCLC